MSSPNVSALTAVAALAFVFIAPGSVLCSSALGVSTAVVDSAVRAATLAGMTQAQGAGRVSGARGDRFVPRKGGVGDVQHGGTTGAVAGTSSRRRTSSGTAPATDGVAGEGGVATGGVRFSEIRMGGTAPGCASTQLAYIEISGSPGTILDGLTYVIIGQQGAGSSGAIRRAVRLDGTIPQNGLFLLVDSTFCAGVGVQPSQVSPVPFGFPLDNLTHLLVRDFTGIQRQDLDFNNDCVLDVTPWSQVIDAFSFEFPGDAGCVYSVNGLGPDPDTNAPPPPHAFRCSPIDVWLPGGEEYLLPFAGGLDTPGFENPTCASAGCPGIGDCCDPHGGLGCDDPDCCALVCGFAPYCCLTEWDFQCTEIADSLCFDCGNSGFQPLCPDDPTLGPCFAPHAGPLCEDLFCAALVCVEDPNCCIMQWDNSCVDLAFNRCFCGNPLNFPCDIIHGSPGCSDCDCCRTVCLVASNCCSISWDAFCVALAADLCTGCGEPAAGECCLFDTTPGCSDLACCEAVCVIDPFCCLVSWDFGCAVDAAANCSRCSAFGNPACGSCYSTVGGPGCEPKRGCSDVQCSIRTCVIDAYCCFVEWDDFCVDLALIVCVNIDTCDDIGSGVSCAVAHSAPGCSELGCCSVVCSVMPTCCDVAWDAECVNLAFTFCFAINPELCTTGCGNPCSQGCFSTSAEPGCDFAPCCFTVCADDPTCCEASWDEDCVQLALLSCCGLPAGGSCFATSGTPFCNDRACCVSVCNQDTFCCDGQWDDFCVELAFELCPEYCFSNGDGRGCFVPSDAPGCGNNPPVLGSTPICSNVCIVDPLCCREAWDAACVETALALYGDQAATGCSDQPCFSAHSEGGCAIISCCTAVCSIIPSCCSAFWDAGCVELAGVLCINSPLFAAPPVCPSEGDCFTVHPTAGCDSAGCCTTVCLIDPFCCDAGWDSGCVSLAESNCSEFLPLFCIPSDRSCFSAHGEPFCADAMCSDIVCAFDDFCCEIAWDFACVDAALLYCQRGCGSEFSGSCFLPGVGAGCRDFGCCERVCSFNSFCCDAIWDALCVQEALALCSGGNCFDAHAGKGCDNAEIALEICLITPECCELNWDSLCAAAAQKQFPLPPPGQPGGCGDPEAGSCFLPHPGRACDDSSCCTTVCMSDTFCCESVWDDLCAESAKELCAELWEETYFDCGELCAGPCFFPKLTPNCSDEECCDDVCARDDFCCTIEWDVICAETAQFLCLECGDPETGSCCFPHLGPYCNDEDCCDIVCALDSFCCSEGGTWDSTCVGLAAQNCGDVCEDLLACGSPFSGDCCFASGSPYCNDETCCNAVCAMDAFCCEQAWDDACANQALITCAELCSLPSCGDPFAGSCFVVHAGPTCDDIECCEFVCTFFDPTCCTDSWDIACVKLAVGFCNPGVCGFPASGDCFFPNGTPGCDDLDCCNFICAEIDFFCCEIEWDLSCANAAVSFCGP